MPFTTPATGPNQRLRSIQGCTGRDPNYNQTPPSCVGISYKACPQLLLQLPNRLLHHPGLEARRGEGVLFRLGAGGRGQWRSPKPGSNLGASPGSTRRCLSTSRSRQGMEKGTARLRLRRPMRVCESASRVAALVLEAAVQTPSRGGGAAGLNVGDPGRGQWKHRQREGGRAHGRGAAAGGNPGGPPCRSGPPGLTPPPACPGSDGSSHRALRAGRGRGRGRRRRKPSGRRGRRRAACNS